MSSGRIIAIATLQMSGAGCSLIAGSALGFHWIQTHPEYGQTSVWWWIILLFPLLDLVSGILNGVGGYRLLRSGRVPESNALPILQILSMLNCNMLTPVCGILVLLLKKQVIWGQNSMKSVALLLFLCGFPGLPAVLSVADEPASASAQQIPVPLEQTRRSYRALIEQISTEKNAKLIITVNQQSVYSGDAASSKGHFFEFRYREGDEIGVCIRQEHLFGFRETLLLERTVSTSGALHNLFDTELVGKNLSSTSLRLRLVPYREGLYQIKLKESYLAPDDILKCGGDPKQLDSTDKRLADALLIIYKTEGDKTENARKILTQEGFNLGKGTLEKLDNWVIVYRNDEIQFDSRAKGLFPCGALVLWPKEAHFSIRWKKDDRIKVEFWDYNKVKRSTLIFSRTDDTASALDLLNGNLFGGAGSHLSFEQTYQKE